MRKVVGNTTFGLCLAAATLAVVALAGCAKSGTAETSPSAPTPSVTSDVTPSAPSTDESSDPTVEGIAGHWTAPDADWAVHFKQDGTFVEDFKGISDFRVGTYTVEGDTVTLIGGDGNEDVGTIKGETIVFTLGTLTRK